FLPGLFLRGRRKKSYRNRRREERREEKAHAAVLKIYRAYATLSGIIPTDRQNPTPWAALLQRGVQGAGFSFLFQPHSVFIPLF
ncbi:hypothetical protein, partial [Aminivibrio sp.]|uniref:hypothetical protein n=1 Tax=Aminivibrio sp. TaxID=1872489 RepID=UPI00345EFAAC